MKTILALLLLLSIYASKAQTVTQLFFTKQINGSERGIGLGYRFKNSLYLGGVFQSNQLLRSESDQYINRFYGVDVMIPFKECGDLAFFLSPKLGMANNAFFVLIPEVTTTISVSNFLMFRASTGIRYRLPTQTLGLMIKF